MSENPLPPSQTDKQDAADRPPVHTETGVQPLTDMRDELEAAYHDNLISTDQWIQALDAIQALVPLVALIRGRR